MKNFVHHLEIQNFKSIQHLKVDCKRVNVFIGKPNVGKSNILEALGLLGAVGDGNGNLTDAIRHSEVSNLFYDDDLRRDIAVFTDFVSALVACGPLRVSDVGMLLGSETSLKKWKEQRTFWNPESVEGSIASNHSHVPLSSWRLAGAGFSPFGRVLDVQPIHPVRYYKFRQGQKIDDRFSEYLLPPYGANLFTVVDQHTALRKEIADIFSEYGLQFVAYKKEGKFEIEKNLDGYVYKYPYSSMADTFQRLIFYLAAIDSNKDAVLILEEPEVHSFPPYTMDIVHRIVGSEDNQFFLTTHSPYVLQGLIEHLDSSQLNVFITYYEDYETKVKQLSQDELSRVADYHIDLFYNLDSFLGK